MSEIITTARSARETLARGLNALQADPNAPASFLQAAEPIAMAMGALHRIERSGGAELAAAAPQALDAVRQALGMLQTHSSNDPRVLEILEMVAGSLGLIFSLTKAAKYGPAPQPAAPQPAVVQPQPAPQPYAPPAPAQPAQYAQQPAYAPAPQPYAPPQPAAPQPAFQPQPAQFQPQPAPFQQPAAFQQQPAFQQPAAAPQAAPYQPPPAPQAAPYQPPPAPYQPQPAAFQPPPQQPAARLQAADPFAPPAHQAAPWGAAPQPQAQQPAFQQQPAPPQPAYQQPAQGPGGVALSQRPATPDEITNAKVPMVEAELGTHSVSNFFKGLSGNDVIDHGGLFISTYNIPQIGQSLKVKVALPGGYEFEALGVVRWTREARESMAADISPPGFGLVFTNISQDARNLVYRYVRNREPMFHDDL